MMTAEDRRRLVQLAGSLKHGVARVSGVSPSLRPSPATRETRATRVSTARGRAVSPSAWDPEDWLEYFHERAAVREFDGGVPRADAERLAVEDTISQWLALHPARPTQPQAGCMFCGQPEELMDSLLSVLAADHGHTWVHDLCHGAWLQKRRAEARAALAQAGIRVDG